MTDILIAIIAFAGTTVGCFGGIIASNKLTNFRIAQLEDKVNKHNNLIERMVAVEQSSKSAHLRINELSDEIERK